jgi:hypothetical protein
MAENDSAQSSAKQRKDWTATLGLIAAWAWAALAGGGGAMLIIEKGPWPLTNGWFALSSGVAACPLTAWLANRFFGTSFSGRARFAAAVGSCVRPLNFTVASRRDSVPLVTLTVRKGKSGEFKSAVLKAVHGALVASGVPEKDRFQRVLELGSDDFRFDPEYPDLTAHRTDDFVLIEILLSVGRSVKVKKKVLVDILGALLQQPGLNPENVMVCFKETLWENWSFGGGRFIHT